MFASDKGKTSIWTKMYYTGFSHLARPRWRWSLRGHLQPISELTSSTVTVVHIIKRINHSFILLCTMPSVEINTEYQNAQRFPAWMALGIFSTVCLASTTSKFAQNERDGNVKWVLACTILSMLIGIAGFAGYLFARGMFVGQLPEIALVRNSLRNR